MHILYISAFPQSYIDELTSLDPAFISAAAQKYNYLTVKGLKENGADVSVLCTSNPLAIKQDLDCSDARKTVENGIEFQFVPYHRNKSIRRKLCRRYIKNYISNVKALYPDTRIILDYLQPLSEYVPYYAGEYTCLITDFPEYIYTKKSLVSSYNFFIKSSVLNRASSYVLMSKQSSERIDPGKKYVVVEGMADSDNQSNESFTKQKWITYTGSISKECGIDRLVEAFKQLNTDYMLMLYGPGPYVEEVKQQASQTGNIKYGGILNNKDILSIQKKSAFLINPRPINSKFSDYSFPSKTFEYMLSGTPAIMAKLNCLPEDYYPYLLLFEDDTVNGIKESIMKALQMREKEKNAFGSNARNYVLEHKNNLIQTRKIINFLS